jgi:predicted RNase H-like nuclease
MNRTAGVDGYRDGWVVAIVDEAQVSWALCRKAEDVLAKTKDCAAVGVDIPMGLPERERRRCDQQARDRLHTTRSSVFFTPPRAVLKARQGDYRHACELARETSKNAISKQVWNILPKINEWDVLLRQRPGLQDRVIEVHPELSIRALARDVRFAGKRTARGVVQRITALSKHTDVLAALAGIEDGPAIDDALDALAVAYSARRWAVGKRDDVLGDGERDGKGLLMRIVV